jgi:predicted ArsR family transcriptional regulator
MDLPNTPGDALAQQTRARLFARLVELRRSAGTDELAAELGLHPNGVRNHLERMEQAGLVLRDRERGARGRPRDRWSVNPEAQPGGEPPEGYGELVRWLVRVIAAAKVRIADVEETGRGIGRELAPAEGPGTAEERLHDTLSALGFQPQREIGDRRRLNYRLGNCPYREAVKERQAIVCALHRGITCGLLDELDPATRLTQFVPEDPDEAGCLIQVRGPMAEQAAGNA